MKGDFNFKDISIRRPLPVWVYPMARLFLWGAALLLFLQYFGSLKMILLGLLAAGAVAAMLRPLWRRIPGSRPVKAVVAGMIFIAGVGGVLAMISWQLVEPVQRQMAKWPQLKQNLNTLFRGWSGKLGLDHPLDVDALLNQFVSFISGQGAQELFARTADVTATILILIMFIFIGSMYLLSEPPGRLVKAVLQIIPQHHRRAMQGVLRDLEPRLRWWLLGTIFGMVSIGAATWAGYSIVGVEFALPLALLTGVTEAVPTVGPAAAFALAVLFAATQGGSKVIGVLIVYAIVQGLESYVLIPLVMRRAVRIPPVVSLFTIVLWGKMLGIAGLLLAIPIDLVIWTILDNFIIRRHRAAAPRAPM